MAKKTTKKGKFDPSTYVMNFGMYKGTKIVDMKSPEQIKYCEWAYKQMVGSNQGLSNKFKAILWHLNTIKENKVAKVKIN